MKFQSLNEWSKLYEGGDAIPDSRSITFTEAQEIYAWVQEKIAPKLGIQPSDMDVIGSYGKKHEDEVHGDLDLAVSSKAIKERNGLEDEDILAFINDTLENMGFETKLMKGFNQVSAGIPILGTDEVAQVDFMISPDLDWSRFAYHSPNFREGESKYKGIYRNLLLVAIITESSKNVLKQTPEGDVEELESNVVRFPHGVYKARKSFMGKKGLVKTGKLLKDFDELITTNPEEVVNLVAGPGYTPESVSSFEKLWHIVTRGDFVHWQNFDAILNKFAANLRSAKLPPPKEALEMYPEIFGDDLVKESLETKEVMEPMADQEHDSWSRWMDHLFKVSEENDDGTVTIPKDKVDRWKKQAETDYEDLSKSEKESDRKEVRKFIKIIKDNKKKCKHDK